MKNLTEFIEKKKALDDLEKNAQKKEQYYKAEIKKHETELIEVEVNIKTEEYISALIEME